MVYIGATRRQKNPCRQCPAPMLGNCITAGEAIGSNPWPARLHRQAEFAGTDISGE